MSRIFIYDSNPDTIQALRCGLEDCGHEVFTNVILKPNHGLELVLNPVDVISLLVHTRPFPDLIIAEAGTVDSSWLCGLACDMGFGSNCSFVLMSHEHSDKIRQIQKLYGAHFWQKPFSVLHFLEYVQTFVAVSC